MSYIVFQNSFSGFKHIRAMDSCSLEEAIQNIQEGCAGCRIPSQLFMYYIYKQHQDNVPLFGTKFNVYKRVKAVAGSKVLNPQTDSHEYAITHNTNMVWLFTDNLFE
jgi:hypothetical protein